MNRNKVRPCDECLKMNTFLCPNSSECFSTEDKPHFRDRMMLLKENNQLQNNWNELKNRTQKKIEQLEYFNEQLKTSPYTPQIETLKLTLKDMQELEGNNGN